MMRGRRSGMEELSPINGTALRRASMSDQRAAFRPSLRDPSVRYASNRCLEGSTQVPVSALLISTRSFAAASRRLRNPRLRTTRLVPSSRRTEYLMRNRGPAWVRYSLMPPSPPAVVVACSTSRSHSPHGPDLRKAATQPHSTSNWCARRRPESVDGRRACGRRPPRGRLKASVSLLNSVQHFSCFRSRRTHPAAHPRWRRIGRLVTGATLEPPGRPCRVRTPRHGPTSQAG
jgi:hypothetical protein